MIKALTTFTSAVLLSATAAHAVILLDSATDDATNPWTAITFDGLSDLTNDNQANSADIELVGDPTAGLDAFYVNFDANGDTSSTDGTLAFRIRVAGDKNPSGFKGYARVGVDVDLDGDLDFFISAELDDNVTIRAAGDDLNNSPSTSSFDSSSTLYSMAVDETAGGNYDWSTVASIDPLVDSDVGDSDGLDYFLSFSIDFSEVVDVAVNDYGVAGFDDTFGLSYIIATGSNSNNFNSDIGGVDNSSFDNSLTWATLGAINDPVTPDGTPVPEVSSYALILGLGALGRVFTRRRNYP